MVLLAAAICTRAGKPLVSRQFVEMSRSRIEGLLAAFPKLVSSGKQAQHTFVETESVRYVYQPLEKMYMVLITTKASNILEDLETLRLFSRVVPEYCSSLEESEVCQNAYELIFAFDEIVALGYRENVNLAQIRTFIEMDSHEEKMFKAVRQTQMEEAKAIMKQRAKELNQIKKEAQRGGRAKGFAGGIGSGDVSSHMVEESRFSVSTRQTDSYESSRSTVSSSKQPSFSKALKLGSKTKDVDSFVDKLRSEGTDVTTSSQPRVSRGAAPPPTAAVRTESVHIRIEEKLSLEAGRDGGLNNLEILGIMRLRVTDPTYSRIRLITQNSDAKGFQLQTHPNVDKKLFLSDCVVTLKQEGKGFPINSDVGVVKWRLQTTDESHIPMTINCWPSESGGKCEVNIEYELQQEDMELQDVQITIPVPGGVGAPNVASCDGEYKHDSKKNTLTWSLPVIDNSNKNGSMEFTIPGRSDDFFPVQVYFASPRSYCDIQLLEVQLVENEKSVRFSSETSLVVEQYNVV